VPAKEGSNCSTTIQATGFPGRTVTVIRRPFSLCEEDFQRRKRLASLLESLHLLVEPPTKKKVEEEVEQDDMQFKVDAAVECDYEGKGEYWPCVVRRVNDNNTYDLEYVGDYKWVGIQRGVNPVLVQKRGEGERKKRGEGVWHWDGMSDSEDEYFRPEEADGFNNLDNDSDGKGPKNRLSFYQFDELGILLDAAKGDEDLCMACLNRLGSVPGVMPFTDIRKLAQSIEELVGVGAVGSPDISESAKPKAAIDSEDMLMLNLLYAPRRSRLHSLLRTLSRIENAGHICAWTKASHSEVISTHLQKE
jgi:hypothetical protein